MTRPKYYICSEISYDFLRQRHQVFADFLSGSYDVVFVERIPSRAPSDILQRISSILVKKLKKKSKSATKPKHLTVVRSLMLPEVNGLFAIYNKYRSRRLFRDADQGDIIHLFANSPSIASFAESKKIKLLFDVVHNWWEFPYHRAKQIKNINFILSKCQIIISDSDVTLEKARASCSNADVKILDTIPPGVSTAWFPEEKAKIRSVFTGDIRIAFFGNLRANSDLDLVRYFKKFEGANLEIYGRLDASLTPDIIREFKPNYQGEFLEKELVSKLQFVQALLLPYDTSSFSSSIFPAKYFEALALGKPIFSNSNLSGLPRWSEFIWTTEDIDKLGWANILSEHYEVRSQKQIAFAQENSWEVRFDKLLGVLDGAF